MAVPFGCRLKVLQTGLQRKQKDPSRQWVCCVACRHQANPGKKSFLIREPATPICFNVRSKAVTIPCGPER